MSETCKLCGAVLPDSQALELHLQSVHDIYNNVEYNKAVYEKEEASQEPGHYPEENLGIEGFRRQMAEENERNRIFPKIDRKWSCSLCTKRFDDEQSLRSHVMAEHNINPEEATAGQWLGAGAKIGKIAAVKAFLGFGKPIRKADEYYDKNFRWICPVCAKKFSNQDSMEWHITTDHNMRPEDVTAGQWLKTGAKIGKDTAKRGALAYGKPIQKADEYYQKNRKWSCSLCTKRFDDEQALNRHMMSAHNTQPEEVTSTQWMKAGANIGKDAAKRGFLGFGKPIQALDEYRLKRKSNGPKVKTCPSCGSQMNGTECTECGYNAPQKGAYYKAKMSGATAGAAPYLVGKYKGRMFEIILFFILGMIAALNPWLPLQLVGVSLILAALFYIPFDSNSIIRAIMKFVIIILLTIQFTLVYPQYFVALGILWVMYFSMPTSYRWHDPDEYDDHKEKRKVMSKNMGNAFSGWMRVIVGAFLSIVIYAAFGGDRAILGIAIMAAAFFITPPHRTKEGEEGGIHIGISMKGKPVTHDAAEKVATIIFISIMLISVITGVTMGGWWGSTLGWVMLGFWIIGFFAGIFAKSAGRPYVGVGLVVIGLFIFSLQFTGTVGTELFGAYWPTVEHYGSMITDPIFGFIEDTKSSVDDAWLLMTCPSCYEQKKLEEERAKAATVKQGGTTKSIELLDFNAVNYGTAKPTIDPAIPFVGTIKLENEGEFTAEDVTVILSPPLIKDPKKVGTQYDKSIDCSITNSDTSKCTYTPLDVDACEFTACTGTLDETYPRSSCIWNQEPTNPGELKLMTFKCGDKDNNYKDWYGQTDVTYAIQLCDCYSRIDTKAEPVYTEGICSNIINAGLDQSKTNGCNLDTHYLVYTYGDYYVTVNMDYSFKYNVEAQATIDIMDEQVFLDKLTAGEITPKEKESKYTGGPVMLTFWIQDQPLRSGEESYATISVANDGSGTILGGSVFTVSIPKDNIENIMIMNNISITEPVPVETADAFVFSGIVTKDLDPDKYARFTFSFKGKLPTDVIEKSTVMTGQLNYTYVNTDRLEFPIISSPIQ